MDNKKFEFNVFKYATKELSQDAFLLWLINNYQGDYEDVKKTSIIFIKNLLGFNTKDIFEISDLKTSSQEFHSDILVTCTINKARKYAILIEDKVKAYEKGNQLNNYKSNLAERYPNFYPILIFYKSFLLTEDEEKNLNKQGWEIFDIERIHKIFSSLDFEIKHNFLLDYIEYINYTYRKLTESLPIRIDEWTFENWYRYCKNTKFNFPENIEYTYGIHLGRYFYIDFNIHGYKKLKPYAIIRSREIKDNLFSIKLVTHDISKEKVDDNIEKWKNHIESSKFYQFQNFKLQIGRNRKKEEIKSVNHLTRLIEEYIIEYAKILSQNSENI